MFDPSNRCNRCSVALASIVFAPVAFSQTPGLISGQNVNMVAGIEWPTGDPFLQRQNEPTMAVSTRNPFHLMAGSNDYRTVDLPGLPEGKTIGDSWVSTYFSQDGGGRWTSTLLPGYPQDDSALGLASPLSQAGYEASADPVIRAGTQGLFYYSGIAFTRSDDPPSAGFVATYMDLNNDPRKNTIAYVRTTLFDQNSDGSSFIDKPWIAVDKPRLGAQVVTLEVKAEDGVVQQTVECGNVYVAYARIQGDGTAAVSSQIMFTRSMDCGGSFSEPIELTLPDTINQGAAVAVEPISGRIQVAWRQFENATLNCTYQSDFWKDTPEAWPVNEIEIAGATYKSGDSRSLFPGSMEKGGTPWLVLRQLLAAWLNVLAGADNSAIAETMKEAEAWLIEFPPGSKPKMSDAKTGNSLRKALDDFNKGKVGPAGCEDLLGDGSSGMLSGLNPNAIMVVSSTDNGETFTDPISITGQDYYPFEQGTTEFSFRTTGYPTMTFDGVGRSYVAYSTRGVAVPDGDPVGGDARIVVTTSMDAANWTQARPIDEPSVPGHQLMPALESSRGKIILLYYDLREDVSGVFDRFIVDLPVDPTIPRHSVDVRAALADAADVPVFTDYSVLDINPSTQASRYPYLLLDNAGVPFSQQLLYNPPNLPMFRGGTVPFFGDYIDLAALHFVKDGAGNWEFDLDAAGGVPAVHAVWTDNRDVVGPPDGDWTTYVPPGVGEQQSIFDPTMMRPECTPFTADRTKMRNQNLYTARLSLGLLAAVPANNLPLGSIQRVFVGFIQNQTDTDKTFRLEILNQPAGGSASFDQFSLETVHLEVVKRQSSIARSIFVTSTDVSASVAVSVVEVDADGNTVPNGLSTTARINPDPTAPPPDANDLLNQEIYTPAVFNPAVFNPAVFNVALMGTDDAGIYNPAIFNPAVFNDPLLAEFAQAALALQALLNPAVFNPAVFNPAVFNLTPWNPAVFNPAVFNPAVFNPAVFNPAVFNPAVFNDPLFNPAIFNPAVFNSTVETSVLVENQGNTTAAYSLNLDLGDPPEGFLFQVMIYKTYLVPSADGCTLIETVEQEALVSELAPDVTGSLRNPDSISFFIAPGDSVVVSVRIVPDQNAAVPGNPDDIDTLSELNLSQSIVPQAVDTQSLNRGETEPRPTSILAASLAPLVVSTAALPNGQVGGAYSATLSTSGGGGSPVTWQLVPGSVMPPGLALTADGQVVGVPAAQGAFDFDVRATDDDQIAEQSLSVTIVAAGVSALSLRADFDLSGETPTGPYECLRNVFRFNDLLDIGESITVSAFDADFTAPVGTFVLTNNFGFPIGTVGYEVFMPVPAFADSTGFLQFDFSEVIDVQSLRLQGQVACADPTMSTPLVPISLCNFDQRNDIAPFQGYLIPGNAPVGQTFTPSVTSLNAVDLQLNTQIAGSGDVFVQIRSGSIIGPILGTSDTVTVSNPGVPALRYRFNFATPVPLAAGSIHAIEVVHAGGVNLGVFVTGIGQGAYPGGTAIQGGVVQPGDDLSFQEGTCTP